MPNSAEDAGATDLPRQIGRYEAFLQIGAGGMGRVYLAADRTVPRTVAPVVIKQLRHDIAEGEDVRAMFMDEARIAIRLDHPNVVKTRDLVVASPDYYLVMEFLEGQSLLQVLNRVGREAVPLEAHLWILAQVLAGLEYAHGLRDADDHALGLVHRDVSPSNVQLCYGGEVKLLDFGIARATGTLATTERGTAKGKIGYAAPEQCLGTAADLRSDLYAVGVMLWEAIARRPRTSGETWQSVLRTRVNGLEPPLEAVCPMAPRELLAMTRRALALDPKQRFATAREFRDALENFLTRTARSPGPDELARLLAGPFAEQRRNLHAAIEAYAAGRPSLISSRRVASIPPSHEHSATRVRTGHHVPLPAPHDSVASNPQPEDTSPIPVDDALLALSRARGITSRPPPPEAALPPAPEAVLPKRPREVPGGGRRRWLVAAVTGAILAAGALGALAARTTARPTTPDAHDRKPAPGGALTTPSVGSLAHPAPGSTAPSAARDGRVKVRLSGRPHSAKLRLDGRRLRDNPYVDLVERTDAVHELSVTADGFEPETREVRFDEDIDLLVELKPRTAARAASGFVHGNAQQVEHESPAPAVEPGMDLQPPAQSGKRHRIDEKDPYAP